VQGTKYETVLKALKKSD